LAVLSQALKATKTELKTIQDKVTYLTDENKVILQEKAMILGSCGRTDKFAKFARLGAGNDFCICSQTIKTHPLNRYSEL
jgi:hypothetical protein